MCGAGAGPERADKDVLCAVCVCAAPRRAGAGAACCTAGAGGRESRGRAHMCAAERAGEGAGGRRTHRARIQFRYSIHTYCLYLLYYELPTYGLSYKAVYK